MYQRIRDLREDRDLMQKDLAACLLYTSFECFIHRVVHQLLALHADDAVVLALLQQAHGLVAVSYTHLALDGGRCLHRLKPLCGPCRQCKNCTEQNC